MSAPAETRPLYWSVRREIWENRSLYIAPIVVAGVALFAVLIHSIHLARRIRTLAALDAAKQGRAIVMPYSMTASVIILTTFIVGVFYCLDALYGERRDRSILFWKSMPVSDRTTVLAKTCVPLVVLPVLACAISLATQLIILILNTMTLIGSGVNPIELWSRLPLASMTLVMLYGVTAHALWFAPIYSWLLLVSAWARRATFIWAMLPIFALYVLEKLSLGTSLVPSFLKYRLQGAMLTAFEVDAGNNPITRLTSLTPLKFLSSPGLWIGLAFAAACLVAAARLRRNREPI